MAVPQSPDSGITSALTRPMQVVDITTRGRKTGKARRIEIVLHNIDGHLYISGQPRRERRSWLANLDADAHFTLHLKQAVRADLSAAAREITDSKERRQVLEGVARHWKRSDVDVMVQYSPLIEVSVVPS